MGNLINKIAISLLGTIVLSSFTYTNDALSYNQIKVFSENHSFYNQRKPQKKTSQPISPKYLAILRDPYEGILLEETKK